MNRNDQELIIKKSNKSKDENMYQIGSRNNRYRIIKFGFFDFLTILKTSLFKLQSPLADNKKISMVFKN